MEKQTLSSPYVTIVPLLLDPLEYNLVQRPVPRLLVPESGTTPTVSSDNQRTRCRRLLCCIRNRLAFNRAACTSIARFLLKAVSFTESSCRQRVPPNLRMHAALINSPERVWSTACYTQRQKLSGKNETSLKIMKLGGGNVVVAVVIYISS